jgi:hypothetical protein
LEEESAPRCQYIRISTIDFEYSSALISKNGDKILKEAKKRRKIEIKRLNKVAIREAEEFHLHA